MTTCDAERTIAFYCDLLGLRLALRKSQSTGELLFLEERCADHGISALHWPRPRPASVAQGRASRPCGWYENPARHCQCRDRHAPLRVVLIRRAGGESR
ncbi:MAG: VOC family protein [Candidatus Devosia symbiotica]|nr:VOC family protein [Candidatus Devosia symbiotica]